jgi:hypothetical protein
MPSVGPLTPEQRYWVIRPLIEAGLGLDRIRDLLFRLGFEAVVSEGGTTVASVRNLVRDQPDEVQTAWTEVIGRMIAVHWSRP